MSTGLGTCSLVWMGSLVGPGATFLTEIILARQLGPADYGAFAAVLGGEPGGVAGGLRCRWPWVQRRRSGRLAGGKAGSKKVGGPPEASPRASPCRTQGPLNVWESTEDENLVAGKGGAKRALLLRE